MGGALAVRESIAPPRGAFGSRGAGVSGFDRVRSVGRAESPFPGKPRGCRDFLVPRGIEVALHDRLEPLTRLRHRVVHAAAKLHFDVLQPRPHALTDGLALDGKEPLPGFPADVREPQKVERFRLTFPSMFPALFGVPPELDPARLVRMEFQAKLPQSFPEILQKAIRFRLVLETYDVIVRIPHDDDVSLCALLAPRIRPKIEDMVQIDIGQQR